MKALLAALFLFTTPVSFAAVDPAGWSCGNLGELQARLTALQTACAGPAQQKRCRAGSGIGRDVSSTVRDCVKGGMPEPTCARIVTCENGIRYCMAGGFRADTSDEAVSICEKNMGKGTDICRQSVSCQ